MSKNISVKLDKRGLERVQRVSPKRVESGLTAAALEGERYTKQSFGAGVSSPGDPPGVQTGALRASIHVETPSRFVRTIVAGTDYAAHLEFGTSRMAARPFMSPMAFWLQRQLPSFFEDIVD